ncbi:MAG: F0F1 ATP synthase subunit delta [Chloroflexota bacterium]
MRPNATARRYARAAYEVASEHGNVEQWFEEVRRAVGIFAEPHAAEYFRDPNISRDDKLATIDDAFRDYQPQLLNLLKILASRQRMGLLPAVVFELAALDRETKGIEEARVTVARELSDPERQDIQERLSGAIGKRIDVTTTVDPAIIGGVVVRIGDRLLDGSVASRLLRLRQELAV